MIYLRSLKEVFKHSSFPEFFNCINLFFWLNESSIIKISYIVLTMLKRRKQCQFATKKKCSESIPDIKSLHVHLTLKENKKWVLVAVPYPKVTVASQKFSKHVYHLKVNPCIGFERKTLLNVKFSTSVNWRTLLRDKN